MSFFSFSFVVFFNMFYFIYSCNLCNTQQGDGDNDEIRHKQCVSLLVKEKNKGKHIKDCNIFFGCESVCPYCLASVSPGAGAKC